MTNIAGVNPSPQPSQQDSHRTPARDFAHELARRDEQVKTNSQGDAKANQEPGFENQLLTEDGKPQWAAPAAEREAAVSAQEAQLAVQTEAQQLARAPVTPAGVTETLLEARVFGWHGMAQAYLSELTAATGDEPRLHAVSEEQASATSTTDKSAEAQPAAPSAPVEVAEPTTAAPQLQSSEQMSPRFAAADTASSNVAELAVADATASSYWSERSVRFTRQRDGASVAWLRDFRISDAEASHLIQFVLSDAKAKGVALSKIMLNGREAWTSPNSH